MRCVARLAMRNLSTEYRAYIRTTYQIHHLRSFRPRLKCAENWRRAGWRRVNGLGCAVSTIAISSQPHCRNRSDIELIPVYDFPHTCVPVHLGWAAW